MTQFILNNTEVNTSLPSGILVLDFIRYHKHLSGTKIGCREGDCGACTVLVGEIKNDRLVYTSATSCLMPLGNADGKHLVTIEGINMEGLSAVQEAFSAEGASQCGFCTPGFIVSLTGFSISGKAPSYNDAIDCINGNICRCTGYKSIERAANRINEALQKRTENNYLEFAVANRFIPDYFLNIKERLSAFQPRQKNVDDHRLRFLGGGTDLYVQQHDTMVHEKIDFLYNKKELKGILKIGNVCEMGSAVTVTDISESEIFNHFFPQLKRYIKLISSTQIRNMATIAGNFTNASPIGDLTIFFLALNARLVLSDGKIRREVALRDFYKGYKSLDKKNDEFIEKICFELPAPNSFFNFEKISKRTNLDIASVNTAIHINMGENVITAASIAAGGIGPVPAYLSAGSDFLLGKKISAELIHELIEVVQQEISPISDARGTVEYKRLLLAQLIKAHFIVLFPEMPLQNLVQA